MTFYFAWNNQWADYEETFDYLRFNFGRGGYSPVLFLSVGIIGVGFYVEVGLKERG